MARRYRVVANGKTIQVGDEVDTFKGEIAILEGWTPRKVYCRLKDDTHRTIHEWYPSVIGCKIEEIK